MAGNETLHFPISHPEQANKPVRTTYTAERKIDIRQTCLDI